MFSSSKNDVKEYLGRSSIGGLSLAACVCISTVCFGQTSNQTQPANKDAPSFPIECARADLDLFTEIEAKGIEGANSTVLVFAQDLLQSARKQCTARRSPKRFKFMKPAFVFSAKDRLWPNIQNKLVY